MVLKKKVGIYSVNDKEELAVLISNHLEIFWKENAYIKLKKYWVPRIPIRFKNSTKTIGDFKVKYRAYPESSQNIVPATKCVSN